MKNLFFLLALLFAAQAHAHGGDEHKEHAHAAPSTVLQTTSAVPTLRAESEQFELVARLYEDELGIYIDRWSSNVPLLHAEIEVEVNGMKAAAKFHEDHGDYAVSDPELLKSLHAAGVHSLVFTIIAAGPPQGPQGGKLADKETDLLTGELQVHEADAMTAISKKSGGWLLIGAFAAVIVIGCGLGVYHLLRARKEGSA
jgi:hypothetical protein